MALTAQPYNLRGGVIRVSTGRARTGDSPEPALVASSGVSWCSGGGGQRGLDCNLGIDVVPGYSQRMLTAGIVNSVDAQPARMTYARQWIYDPQQGALQEI